jgi:hypothetical protein
LHPPAMHPFIYQRIIRHIPFLKKEYQYSFSANPEYFVETTKKYIDAILVRYMGRQRGRNFVLDQPFSPNNPEKSFPYFENPAAIVVDRDPRDLYLYEKFYRRPHKRNGLFPTDVEGFVSVYRNLRENMPYLKSNNVLNIRFEDMIYEYDRTTKKIVDFLDLKEHSHPKTIFKPEISASNTRLFDVFNDKENIHYIERELPEYLYPYQNYEKLENRGRIFGENPLYNNRR